MSSVTTDGLVHAASRGDERALERIYRDYHQPLYRYCLAIVGNPQDAQDALQNTMVKMLRSLPGEERSIALKPWLYRVAHNESIDLLRRRRPNAPLEVSEHQLGEELAVQVETRQRLRQLIADLGALPERQRETLLMREAAGLSFEEIGEALNTSSAVARQTLYEARLGLRQMDAGREMECEAITKALSDGDGRVRRRRDIRAHLRDCTQCRHFAEEIDSRSDALAAISPLPAVAAAAMLQGLIGGSAGGAATGAGAGGTAGLVGGAAAKSVGTVTLLKGVAAVAIVAAVGIGAADRAGLIHDGGNSGSPTPAGAGPAGAAPPTAGASGNADSTSARPDARARTAAKTSLGTAASLRAAGAERAVNPTRSTSQSTSAGEPATSEPASASPAPASSAPASSEGSETPAAPDASGAEHPHGRGHAKQTPAAAAHGQETAASHKPEKTGSSNGSQPKAGQTKSAEHPVHPTHPTTPAASSPPPNAAEPEAKSPPAKPPK
jgi:RNA polymerase sigma factor (sigma-70 family)